MPPDTQVADVKSDGVNADSSVNDILKEAAKQSDTEATGADESTADKQGTEGQEDTTGKVEKTGTEVTDGQGEDLEKDLVEGQPIPYDRFKKVNEERKSLKGEIEQVNARVAEFDKLLENPEVYRAVRKAQGLTEEAINAELKEMGVEVEAKDGKEPIFDLTTTDGWIKNIQHLIRKELDGRIKPVEQTLTQTQRVEQERQFGVRMDKERQDAEKLAKEVYGIEYGDEKNPQDPSTASFKILAYLQKHPDKVQAAAHGVLTKSDLLDLAMRGEAVKRGEQKGEKKEKERVAKVKNAAMESESGTASAETPQPDWPVSRIREYMDSHPNWHP